MLHLKSMKDLYECEIKFESTSTEVKNYKISIIWNSSSIHTMCVMNRTHWPYIKEMEPVCVSHTRTTLHMLVIFASCEQKGTIPCLIFQDSGFLEPMTENYSMHLCWLCYDPGEVFLTSRIRMRHLLLPTIGTWISFLSVSPASSPTYNISMSVRTRRTKKIKRLVHYRVAYSARLTRIINATMNWKMLNPSKANIQ
jgi:hypothetical protein